MAKLNRQVLVLNRYWQPIHICSAKRAFHLLFLGHADVVHGDDDEILTHDLFSWMDFSSQIEIGNENLITGVRLNLCIPEVIVLKRYDRLPRREVKFSRHKVLQRDSFTCQYCGVRFSPKHLNVDHVVPKQKGGRTTWENLVCSCIPCNTRKANKLPHEARMFPLKLPRAPRWTPMAEYTLSDQAGARSIWRHFLQPSSDRVQLTD